MDQMGEEQEHFSNRMIEQKRTADIEREDLREEIHRNN